MAVHPRKPLTDEEAALRKEGGDYLRQLRKAAGLSQSQLAVLIGTSFATNISQYERGERKIAPEEYHIWAASLKVDLKIFVRNLLRYYEPISFKVLFGDAPSTPNDC